MPDTHLAALMRENGERILYTRDSGLRRSISPMPAARSPEDPIEGAS
jgi:hypothetical protein